MHRNRGSAKFAMKKLCSFCVCLCMLILAATAAPQAPQTIYWKKDHIYSGPGGKEIAIVTPPPVDQTAPTAPSGLASTSVMATSVQIHWSASTDTGGSNLAGYKVYRQIASFGALPVGTIGPGVQSFRDDTVKPNTAYVYTVV